MSHTKFESMLQKAIDTRMHEISRRRLFRNAAIAGGSMAAIGTVGFVGAQDATPEGDDTASEESPFADGVKVLNYALTLEHLETAFYRDGLAEIGADGITALGFQEGVFDRLSEIGDHEAAHVEALTATITELGGEPVEEAEYDFGYGDDPDAFLEVAAALENTGVSAYDGAAAAIESVDLLAVAGDIVAVEARHASYLNLVNGEVPFPDSFETPLSPDEVLEIAGPFIQS